MKLQHLKVYKYKIPLKEPLFMKGKRHSIREGIIVELIADSGLSGFGDAAPFPGLHNESVSDIILEIKRLSGEILKISVSQKPEFSQSFKLIPECSPSLQFALEWAVIDLLAKSAGKTPAQILNPESQKKLKINALISGDLETSLSQARQIKTENYNSVKIKVGTESVDDDIERILAINEIFESKLNLRLDANQNWSFNKAVKFGKAINEIKIDYIEEPLDDPARFADFYNETGIHYAFDETLGQEKIGFIKDFSGAKAIIIKPALIGGMANILKWRNFALKNKMNIIYTSVFESCVGLWAVAWLAAAWGTPGEAMGLDTYKWLERSICKPPFSAYNSELSFPIKYPDFQPEKNMLTEIQL